MLTTIVAELILASLTFYSGQMLWQLSKRDRFLNKMIGSRAHMAAFITIEMLEVFSKKNSAYMNKRPEGYIINVSALITSDVSTQRRLKLVFASLSILAMVISVYAGQLFFLLNFSLLLLIGILPLAESGRRNALDHLITLGALLYKWRQENQKECDEWITQASSLKELYALVQTAK